ncbi:MAG TPA: TIGR03560 family F420-dependent LLM class oxidoreductase [Thermomonospora sp.]|nr:TIGR03560 family F420-dependent LLM class oxidoreductase [Thermomonospora sp.]
MAMKLSLFLPTGVGHDFAGYSDPAEVFDLLTELALAADEKGYTSVWAADHFVPVPPSPDFMFECWTTLTALARETRRVRLGHLVTGNGYRHPALQAKMASTLDVVSGGRLTFGIGAGWYEEEYRSHGFPFPDAPGRLRMLRESAQIIRSMLTRPRTTFDGEYYQVREALNEPKGLQRPHVPMMVAGAGEKVTLRIVAEYADACNVQAPRTNWSASTPSSRSTARRWAATTTTSPAPPRRTASSPTPTRRPAPRSPRGRRPCSPATSARTA